jgi:hypothetical protein
VTSKPKAVKNTRSSTKQERIEIDESSNEDEDFKGATFLTVAPFSSSSDRIRLIDLISTPLSCKSIREYVAWDVWRNSAPPQWDDQWVTVLSSSLSSLTFVSVLMISVALD